MPRSTCIYVVVNSFQEWLPPLATFTVKYEMVIWLKQQSPTLLKDVTIWRCQDGTHQSKPPSEISLASLRLA